MNYQWNQNHLNYKEDFEALRRGGFTEHEIEQLTQLQWRIALQDILFKEGDIVEHGEEAEEAEHDAT